MRIPDNTLYMSRVKTYGSIGFEMEGVDEEPGCPRLYRAKYEDFRIREPASAAASYGSLIHDALYLSEQEDLPPLPDALDKAVERLDVTIDAGLYDEAVRDLTKYMDREDRGRATIAVEQHLTAPLVEIDGIQYFFGGYIDKLEIDPDDPHTIYVVDYKTNRQPPSQSSVDRNNQFTMYCALVRANLDKYMPGVDPDEVRFVGVMDAIKWYELETWKEGWQLDQFLDWLSAICRRIVADQDALPVLNDGCSWCPVKYDCPEFKRLPGKGDTIADRMSTTTDLEQRVFLMQQAQLTIKGLDKIVKEVKAELLDQAVKGTPVTANGVTYQAEDAWENQFDIPKLHELLGEMFYNVVTPTAYKINAAIKDDPEKKNQLDAITQRIPKEKPQLKARKAE